MEPQHMYEQKLGYGHDDSSSNLYSHGQEKVKLQSNMGMNIFIGVLQILLVIFSIMNYTVAVYFSLPISINYLLINVCFFLIAYIMSRKIFKNRRILYVCFVFVLSVTLLIACTILIMSNAIGGVILAWAIVLLVATTVYWLAKLLPPVTI